MQLASKYSSLILNFQTQRRNEDFTPAHQFAPLTMSEIETSLLSMDEHFGYNKAFANTARSSPTNGFNKNRPNKTRRHGKSNFNGNSGNRSEYKGKNTSNLSQSDAKLCFYCKKPGHWKNECPVLQQKNKNGQNPKPAHANSLKETERKIELTSDDISSAKVNMAIEHDVEGEHPSPNVMTNDLENWVLDSGCTSHMTPFLSDFDRNSMTEVEKVIEVAEGHEIMCRSKGTISMTVYNDIGERIVLEIIDILYVPDLSRRLFSSMSLYRQKHTVCMKEEFGVRIWFKEETHPISQITIYLHPAQMLVINLHLVSPKRENKIFL